MSLLKTSPFQFVIALIAVVLFFFVRSWQGVDNPSWEQPTMGTLCHITLSGSVSKKQLTMLREQIDAELENVNRVMSTWQPDTQISQFNDFESQEPFPISSGFNDVVRRALEISAATDGAFDPTVKPLVDHWGFGAEADPEPVVKIMQAVGWRKVRVENAALIKNHPAVQLDLSAIAKGYGVDAVSEVIRSAGHHDFLVEIGGEISTSGLNPKGTPWRVGIEAPHADAEFGADILRAVELSGGAMATSGDYRNFRTLEDGTLYSHIIDPVTGMPAKTDIASVSVLADSCMDADAVATALFVMGSEKGLEWLGNHPEFESLFVLHSTNQSFTVRTTDGFPE